MSQPDPPDFFGIPAIDRFFAAINPFRTKPSTEPMLDGKPLWQWFDTHRNDLVVMSRCCDLVERAYLAVPPGHRLAPAPAYFLRVAILSRKAKDFSGEIAACERWMSMARDYAAQAPVQAGRCVQIDRAKYDAFSARAEKARTLIGK